MEVLKGKEREKELEDGTQTKSMKNQGRIGLHLTETKKGRKRQTVEAHNRGIVMKRKEEREI